MDVIGIVLSLFLLMFMAYRGFSVIVFAPVFALLAAVMQGMPIMPTYTELFMSKGVVYVKNFFPVFMLGAIFGKVMEETGLAKSISHVIIEKLGQKHAVLSVVLSGAILTYGGVSMFVVVFAVYPFAAALFREANIPKRLIPGCICLSAFTFTMDCLPGSPQIQNIIPTNFYGTTAYSAPWLGLFAGTVIFCAGMLWLEFRKKQAMARGEGYGEHTINESTLQVDVSKLPPWYFGVFPLLVVLCCNYFLSRVYTWDPNSLQSLAGIKLPLMVPAVKNAISTWSLIISLVLGIGLGLALGWKNLPKKNGLQQAINAGAIGSLLAIMNTASEVGYGNVIAALPGFTSISQFLMGIKVGSTPLFSEAVTVNVLAGITGSASGGMSIALDLMSKDWMAWAAQSGVSNEVLHRIASMASGGMDTLPHNGAIITLLAVCGLTHRQSYPEIGMITAIKTLTAFLSVGVYALTGLS